MARFSGAPNGARYIEKLRIVLVAGGFASNTGARAGALHTRSITLHDNRHLSFKTKMLQVGLTREIWVWEAWFVPLAGGFDAGADLELPEGCTLGDLTPECVSHWATPCPELI